MALIDLVDYKGTHQIYLKNCKRFGIDASLIANPDLSTSDVIYIYNQALYGIKPEYISTDPVEYFANLTNNRENAHLITQLDTDFLDLSQLVHGLSSDEIDNEGEYAAYRVIIARYNKHFNKNIRTRKELHKEVSKIIEQKYNSDTEGYIKLKNYKDFALNINREVTKLMALELLGVDVQLPGSIMTDSNILDWYVFYKAEEVQKLVESFREYPHRLDWEFLRHVKEEVLNTGRMSMSIDSAYYPAERMEMIEVYNRYGIDIRYCKDYYRKLTPDEIIELRKISNAFRYESLEKTRSF